jgi:hypothetical protein
MLIAATMPTAASEAPKATTVSEAAASPTAAESAIGI